MTYKYFPHTERDISMMLDKIGVKSLDELFSEIPECVRFRKEYNIPSAKSELEIRDFFRKIENKNKKLICFSGAGVYDHYTPSVIPNILSRSEYLTSYTPYQAEISQGTLHYIFEYQSMMAEMTGMDISNASMYDGATATAEAVLMANASVKKANTVLVSETVDPKTINVIKTYAHFNGINIELITAENGITSIKELKTRLTKGDVSGVVVQQPNYYGIVEDYHGFSEATHEKKSLLIMNSIISDLAILKTPGEWGADIAVGDVQSLGIPMFFGGAYAGYMCCKKGLIRKMPGRIVGKTLDQDGKRAFVLTLQAREQHIRRQKATSNICSNESLMTLFVTIYMSLLGKEGIKEVAQRSYDGAHYLYNELLKTKRFTPAFDQPFFNEFCVKYNGSLDALQKRLIENGILGGIKISKDTVMFAVTESRTKEEIDNLVKLTNI